MKLRSRWNYGKTGASLTISEAVVKSTWSEDPRGELEEMRSEHMQLTNLFATVVEMLHTRGVLNDADILTLLGGMVEVKE